MVFGFSIKINFLKHIQCKAFEIRRYGKLPNCLTYQFQMDTKSIRIFENKFQIERIVYSLKSQHIQLPCQCIILISYLIVVGQVRCKVVLIHLAFGTIKPQFIQKQNILQSIQFNLHGNTNNTRIPFNVPISKIR